MDPNDIKKQAIWEIIQSTGIPIIVGFGFFIWLYSLISSDISPIIVIPFSVYLLIPLYFFSGSVPGTILLILITFVNIFIILLIPNWNYRYLIVLENIWLWSIYFTFERYQKSYLNQQNLFREQEEVRQTKIAELENEKNQHLKRFENIERQISNYQLLGGIIKDFSSTLKESKVINLIIQSAINLVGKGTWTITKEFSDDSIAFFVKKNNIPVLIYDINKDNRFSVSHPKFRSAIFFPLDIEGEVWSILKGQSTKPDAFNEQDLRFISLLGGISSIAISNVKLYQRTQELAITDSLTGLYIQNYFKEWLREEMLRAKKYDLDLSIAFIDIDYFKKINDNYGHEVGDQILKKIADLIRSRLRETDFIARYGGEEFSIIMTQTNSSNAFILCEQLRKHIENERFFITIKNFKSIHERVTVSIGISSFTPSIKNSKEFIKQADEALYFAKNNGRNRVELWTNIKNINS